MKQKTNIFVILLNEFKKLLLNDSYKSGMILCGLFFTVTIIIIKYINPLFLNNNNEKNNQILFVTLITGICVITLSFIVNFLNEDKQKFSKNDDKPNNDLSFFDKRRIEKEVNKIVSEKINLELSKDVEIVNLEEKITQKISNTLSNGIIDDLEERFSEDFKNEYLEENLYDLTNNIDFYIDRIQKNSTVNLIIGIFATIIAISILSFEVLSEGTFTTIQEFLIHFLPRFSLVIFIQLFAFFFLRLYKNNLEDAKYFQNELTNLTAKTTSIKIASLKKNDDLLFEIVRNLSNTERNFKLLKDETLQTIENKKIETENDKDIMAQLKEMLSKFEINKTA